MRLDAKASRRVHNEGAGASRGEGAVGASGGSSGCVAGRSNGGSNSLKKEGALRVLALATAALALATWMPGESAFAQENPAGISRAYTIPTSDLVFEGSLALPAGVRVEFFAREGALTLFQPENGKDNERFGFILTLDREGAFGPRDETVIVQRFKIEDHPAGGEGMYGMPPIGGSIGETILVPGELGTIEVIVSGTHFEEFKDQRVITTLWQEVRRNAHALDEFEGDLYPVYGPCALSRLEHIGGEKICSTRLMLRTDDPEAWRGVGQATVESTIAEAEPESRDN